MKALVSAVVILLVAVVSAQSATRKGTWSNGKSVRVIEKAGNQVTYCTQGLPCLNATLQNGSKLIKGDGWTVGITKSGTCYKLRFVDRSEGIDMRTKAC